MNSPAAFTRDSGTSLQTGHAGFNKKADLIMAGNVYSSVQSSTFIRARQDLECNGYIRDPGYLQDFDLDNFCFKLQDMRSVLDYIKRTPFFETNAAIAYRFFHLDGKSRHVHGVVVTDTHHQMLRRFDRMELGLRHSEKSCSVLDACKQYICIPAASTRALALA